jgi:hypothetical protein
MVQIISFCSLIQYSLPSKPRKEKQMRGAEYNLNGAELGVTYMKLSPSTKTGVLYLHAGNQMEKYMF